MKCIALTKTYADIVLPSGITHMYYILSDIAEKIRIYLNNPELLLQQGENGYNYAKAHFDREKLALRYLEFLEEVVR